MTSVLTIGLVLSGAVAIGAPTAHADPGEPHLWVDPLPSTTVRTGQSIAAALAGPAVPDHPLADTFRLHSLPGATKVIYIDFDGHEFVDTYWNSIGLPNGPVDGYTVDADPAFSDDELALVQDVWARVAEDFAPFNVDVTTEDPGVDAIDRTDEADETYGARALVTTDDELWQVSCGRNCSGVATGNVFDATGPNHRYSEGAITFSRALGDLDPKTLADTVSHELGHNFSLGHSEGANENGGFVYEGHGPWMPIMGNGFYFPISQWSRGEYAGATNTTDELATIASKGVGFRADAETDQFRDTPAGFSSDRTYLINNEVDTDYIRIGTCVGPVSYHVSPAPHSPNLDIAASLVSYAGRPLAYANPQAQPTDDYDIATGLDAQLDYPYGGEYWLQVSGTSLGDPATTGYSRYGTIGTYTISGTTCAPSEPTALVGTSGTDGRSLTFTWAPPVTDGDSPVTGYAVALGDGSEEGTFADVGLATSHTFTGLEPGGFYRLSVRATNAIGTGSVAATFVTPTGLPGGVRDLAVTPAADGTSAEVTWTPPAEDGGTDVTHYVVTRTDAEPLTLDAAPTGNHHTWSGLTPGATYTFSVLAQNAVGYSVVKDRTVTLPGGPPEATVPLPPRRVIDPRPSLDATELLIGWLPPGYDGGSPVIGYDVAVNGIDPVRIGVEGAYTFTGLRPGNIYVFSVRARNAVGVSDPLSFVVEMPQPARAPDPPRDLVAVPGPEPLSYDLSWRPPYFDGRSPLTGYAVTLDGREVARTPDYTYQLTGLAPGTTYTVGVAAVNDLGTGLPATTTVTTASTPLPPPNNGGGNPQPTTLNAPVLGGVVGGRPGGKPTITVSWSSPSAGVVPTGYLVRAYRISRKGKVVKTLTSATLPATQRSLKLVLRAGRYQVEVVPIGGAGEGPSSARSKTVRAR